MGTHPTLRIFLSSTDDDLKECRASAREAILQLDALPVARESFAALPGTPVAECCARAASASALVVLVAHRYGYVPKRVEGGDGERSITWLEVQAALDAGKPVFAFLADFETPLGYAGEQNERREENGRDGESAACVQALREFRAYLKSHFVCDTFSGPDELAKKLAFALAKHFLAGAAAPGGREWPPLVFHPLQPAPYFHGRTGLREELVRWAGMPATSDRVVSLVALGGTGKTALIQQVLTDLDYKLPAGLLVWSFYYLDATPEEFLRVAAEYFTGECGIPAGARLERLQRALAGDTPHLLVIDGLERVQSDGHDGQDRGSVTDPKLKRLLCYLAGGSGRTRALIASRFPLVDL
ncbi:MAG TPA: DUF4062 domain-containing protein, partial [Longimicrobiaceae bacterium]|nr:DUF4062 domain-containing protein [Longimicrobiaceae bacterium]